MADESTTSEALPPAMAEAMAQVFGHEPAASTDTPAETPEAKAAAAPAAEETKPEVPDRVAARIAAARRADMRAAEARREMAAQRAEMEKQRAELAELTKVAEQAKAAKLSPSKLLELSGLDPKTFLERLATEHEPASVAARVAESTKSETEKLREELEAFKKERADEERRARAMQLETDAAAAQQAFVEHVASKADAYPHLIEEFTPEEIAAEGMRLAEQHAAAYKARFGDYPDDEVIAEHLEALAKARAERRAAWRARIGKNAQVPSKGERPGEKPAAQSDQGQSPRTLTSRTAGAKAAAPKPWSQELADEESLRILKGATG